MSESDPRCPVELTLNILGGRWRTVILAHLKTGAKRYRDLRGLVPSLSDKMLTQRLHELQEAGLVSKLVDDGAARYALTDEGRSLAPVLQALHDWGAERWPGPSPARP